MEETCQKNHSFCPLRLSFNKLDSDNIGIQDYDPGHVMEKQIEKKMKLKNYSRNSCRMIFFVAIALCRSLILYDRGAFFGGLNYSPCNGSGRYRVPAFLPNIY